MCPVSDERKDEKMDRVSDFATEEQLHPGDERLCCNGNCRLAAIQQMTRAELMDALVEAEEGLAMAELHIAELEV